MDNKYFVWDEKTIKDYGEFTYFTWKSKGYYNREEGFKEFLQSKQPKRDWQIVEWDMSGKYKNAKDVTNEAMIECGCKIKSVLRIPDGEVFSVGDFCEQGEIKRFNYSDWSKSISATFESGGVSCEFYLSDLRKAPEKPKPLFTEEEINAAITEWWESDFTLSQLKERIKQLAKSKIDKQQ